MCSISAKNENKSTFKGPLYKLGWIWWGMPAPLAGTSSKRPSPTWLPRYLQLAGYRHPFAQSSPTDSSGWVRVLYDAHGGTEKLTFRRKNPLADLSPPLLNLHRPSLNIRRVVGGTPAREGVSGTEGGGRHGLRGGISVHSPALLPSVCVRGSRHVPWKLQLHFPQYPALVMNQTTVSPSRQHHHQCSWPCRRRSMPKPSVRPLASAARQQYCQKEAYSDGCSTFTVVTWAAGALSAACCCCLLCSCNNSII